VVSKIWENLESMCQLRNIHIVKYVYSVNQYIYIYIYIFILSNYSARYLVKFIQKMNGFLPKKCYNKWLF